MIKLINLLKEINISNDLKFRDIEPGNTYVATRDFSIFKKGDQIKVTYARPVGSENIIVLKNKEGKTDQIQGDLGDDVEVFK
jgi:hypothetical protein